MIADADWCLGWADTVPGFPSQEILHQAVFQGMVGNEHQSCARVAEQAVGFV